MPTIIGEHPQQIDAWSAHSLLFETCGLMGDRISTGTGFVVQHKGQSFFVTAEHVFSGIHPETKEKLTRAPEGIRIFHHDAFEGIGAWGYTDETLRTERGEPRWSVHPRKSIKSDEQPTTFDVDVAVLPLQVLNRALRLYPIDFGIEPARLAPGFPISVVGFPFGQGGPGALLPIWKTGHVASDLYWSERSFLIDVTARDGMSGSPVYSSQWVPSEDGWDVQTSFVGIYSGRTRSDSEIGIVWRAELLEAIVDLASRTTAIVGG